MFDKDKLKNTTNQQKLIFKKSSPSPLSRYVWFGFPAVLRHSQTIFQLSLSLAKMMSKFRVCRVTIPISKHNDRTSIYIQKQERAVILRHSNKTVLVLPDYWSSLVTEFDVNGSTSWTFKKISFCKLSNMSNIFKISENNVTIKTGNDYHYHYIYDSGYDVTGHTSVQFSVMACNDAHVALSKTKGVDTKDTYEVVIGGWPTRSQSSVTVNSVTTMALPTITTTPLAALSSNSSGLAGSTIYSGWHGEHCRQGYLYAVARPGAA